MIDGQKCNCYKLKPIKDKIVTSFNCIDILNLISTSEISENFLSDALYLFIPFNTFIYCLLPILNKPLILKNQKFGFQPG